MKILWVITNLNYKQEKLYLGCGWVSSLSESLKSQTELEIAVVFFSDQVKVLTVQRESHQINYVIPSYLNIMDKVKRNLSFKDFLYKEREDMFLQVINEFNPDLIHVFGTENPFGLITLKTSIPVLIHIQGIINPVVNKWFPTGYNNLYIVLKTSFIKVIKLSGYWADYIRYKKNSRRELEIFKVTKFFCGRTDWDHRIVKLLGKSAKYYHCDEMLRPSFYLNQWISPKKKNSIKLFSIINANMYKGIETIFETAKLLKAYTHYNISWYVAGIKHDSQLVKIFSGKTKILYHSVNVEFLGPMEEVELVKAMLDSDLFIHPSHIDNSPNSLCEAMMLGMPIISTNVGGIQSLITDKVEGILVQDGESFGLAGAILELVSDIHKAISYGEKARQRAIQRHDPSKIVDRQIDIYNDILNNNETENSHNNYYS